MKNEKIENIIALNKQLREENEELKKYIRTLEEQLSLLHQDGEENWVNLKTFKEAMTEAKNIERQYQQAVQEIDLIKQEYRKKLDEMIQQY